MGAAFCDFSEAVTGCGASSVAAVVVGAVAMVVASTGVACAGLDGGAESCRLSGALTAGGTGEMVVESAPGLRGIAITAQERFRFFFPGFEMPNPKEDPKSPEWRPYIFARDQWHCRICGDRFQYSETIRKHIAHAHHENIPPSMYEYFRGAVWQRKKIP
jgi:hypothetical protein